MAVDFRPGDEIRLPFLILAEDAIVDLSLGAVAGELIAYSKSKVADLTTGNSGIIIEQPAPPVALDPADQTAHGLVVISEVQSATLPIGANSRIVLSFTTANGIKMSAHCITLNGVTC